MQFRALYTKCFNAISDMIQAKEDEIADLKKLQIELEEMYVDTDEENKPIQFPKT